MLASRFGTTALPDNMADDSMEISSERGHSIGEEDIDIDIDFTAGQVDEDYVLEDVTSNADFGDDFHPQPSPAAGHDDLMIDDDFESYSIAMDEEPPVQEEDNQNMERDPLAMSFPQPDVPAIQLSENYSEEAPHLTRDGSVKKSEGTWDAFAEQSHSVADGSMKQSEFTWEHQDEAEQAGGGTNLHLEHPEGHHEDGDQQDGADTKEFPATATDIPHEETQDFFLDSNPKDSTVGEQPSPSTSSSAPDLESSKDVSDEFETTLGIASNSEEIAGQIIDSDSANNASLSHEVIVVYQDSEFDLFSRSDTDHPDSFFLSDLSVADEPLVKFFEAIRDVIRADLTDEEELCICIEDLGLEIEETSSLTQSTTIGQIISLHEQLLRNDEVESVRPLCILLNTRANFAIRFANLTSGASEGKGLSELVQRDEQSEGFEETAEVERNRNENEEEHEVEFPVESDESNKGTRDADESKEGKTHQGSEDRLAHVSTADQETPLATGYSQAINAADIAVTDGNSPNYDTLTQLSTATDVSTSQKNENSGTGEYDEDDLLDYSDEEDEANQSLQKDAESFPTKLETDDSRTHGNSTDFITPCYKPHTCFCSKCIDLISEEYEAKNEELEELRRRSISRSDKNDVLEQPAEPSRVTEDGDVDHETYLETDNVVEYDENDGRDFGESNAHLAHEDPSANFGDRHTGELDNPHDESFPEAGDVGGSEETQSHDLTLDSRNVTGQESFEDEIEFEGNDNEQLQKLPGEQTPSHGDQIDSVADGLAAPFSKEPLSVGSSLGFVDAGDSESAASEKTLEAQSVSNDGTTTGIGEEHEDEIGYDDEDDEEQGVVEGPTVKELQTLNNGSGKRPRAEEDGISMASKEAKRPRS